MSGGRLRRVLRSLTFRLGLIYVALFVTSLALLFGTAWWIGVHRPLTAEADRVRTEAAALVRVDATEGRAALIRALDRRREGVGKTRAFHALVGSGGVVATANLPSWPREQIAGWQLLEADLYFEGQEIDFEALVVERRLADGARLIVGRDVEEIDDRDEMFTLNSAWMIAIAALLAVGGSLAMGAAISRRIDAVTRTARRVMAGSLTERIPLRGTGDDFDELAETLNLMLGRIEEAVESVRRVSDNVAHELRTPLARLHADLDELRTADNDAERERLAEQAVAEAERLQAIFDALLRIARIESGRHFAGMKPVDLSLLLADAVELHGPDAEDHAQTIAARIAPGLTMEADRNLLFQAISNLLDNAVKYGGEGGSIYVEADAIDGRIWVAISDSGPGIAPAYRERVKERFFRLPETAGRPGTGLGLALVAAIVALHKGSMEIGDAAPGTKVVLTF
ncbi:HAMP domain-containing protein [Sphingopyxis sp. OPL5]|uniref:sensor histidine kinase n=1 Tax=Sphingopyxis sp. OPL5 TaxID=2486273 RepID=UPI00164E1447|nr:ATP-binding protein [Sphingopyxis sp. OPL5]QNO27666.1 HAMP domain-containing protein [Sphingopyxis sp. OPL5]